VVDRLERQLRLEARLGRGVDPAGGVKRAVAIELGAVAPEAERALSAWRSLVPNSRSPLWR